MTTATGCWRELERLTCGYVPPARPLPGLLDDARAGLLRRPLRMPPKYFYDARGSQLFDAICDTPEYYPTRTESALLAACAGEIVALTRPAHIIEFGSGTARKTRHLFDACAAQDLACEYWPFDVCENTLVEAGRALVGEYPWLNVRALVGDCLGGLRHMPVPAGRRLFLFLGGTIGNFTTAQAIGFLREVRARMHSGDWLLLGADRVKDGAVLHAAYNDAAGITAAFNLNLLHVLNRELGADFDVEAFEHSARYVEARAQIEMYLIASAAQRVRLGRLDATLGIAAGESILTEISRKFTPAALERLHAAAGLDMQRHFEPSNGYYSLVLARCP